MVSCLLFFTKVTHPTSGYLAKNTFLGQRMSHLVQMSCIRGHCHQLFIDDLDNCLSRQKPFCPDRRLAEVWPNKYHGWQAFNLHNPNHLRVATTELIIWGRVSLG